MYPDVIYRRQMGNWWEDLASGVAKFVEPLAKVAPDIAKAIAISQGKYIPTQGGSLVPSRGSLIPGSTGTGTGSSGITQLPTGQWVMTGPQGQVTPLPAPNGGFKIDEWILPIAIGGGALLLIMSMRK